MTDTTITTTAGTNFDKSLTELVKRTLEEVFRPTLPWVRECIKATFIPGTNNTMRYLSVSDIPVDIGNPGVVTPGTTVWLEEGVTPGSDALDFGYEEFSANQAGKILKLTDKVQERWASGSLLALAKEKVTRHAAATADKRVSDVIGAGANKFTVDGGARSALTAADVVTGKALRKAKATLAGDMVPPFGDGYYHAIIHSDVVYDIEGDDAVGGWIDANKYAGTMALFTGEIGKFAGIRFIESANAKVYTAGGSGSPAIDVYGTTVFGPNAFVFGDWGTIEVFVTLPGGPGDELHQRASVGWKAEYGAMIVGEGTNHTNVEVPRYVRIESASGLD